MLNCLCRTALWFMITALTGRAAYGLPVLPVPAAPSLTTPDSQAGQAIDEPLCFMRTSRGNFINLERLCSQDANLRDRLRAEDQVSRPNPVRFGTGRSYAEDAQ